MKALFDEVSMMCSKLTTKRYSTSFSLGILFLKNPIRNPIYAIYGFVRFADEIVDSFDGYDKKYLLYKFRADLYEALEHRISLNPILNSFQQVIHQYNIDIELVNVFLDSMEMDLEKQFYVKENYEKYILGSAEVVGLMCLKVFLDGNQEKYDELKPFAMKLGAAFQKINFLRDLKDDYKTLGRTYFPNVDMNEFTLQSKREIEDEIALDFKEALIGIKNLPVTSKGGVYLAYVYYLTLFEKIKRVSVERVLVERIRVSNGQKIALMFKSMLQFKTNML
jgi:phytoene/squalene synthetase